MSVDDNALNGMNVLAAVVRSHYDGSRNLADFLGNDPGIDKFAAQQIERVYKSCLRFLFGSSTPSPTVKPNSCQIPFELSEGPHIRVQSSSRHLEPTPLPPK
jgi:hypothetical protein